MNGLCKTVPIKSTRIQPTPTKTICLSDALNHTNHGHHIVDTVGPQNGTSLVRDLAVPME